MARTPRISTQHHYFGEYEVLIVNVIPTTIEHIVPPAGEEHAFDVQRYKHRVEICVSPSGRSVQVHINGKRVH